MLSGWLHTSPSWLNAPRREARWLLCPQLRVWSCSASHSRCGEKGSDPILYTWIIPMHRQPQGANARDVKPTDLQTFSHDCCGHLVLTVGLPHAQPIITLAATQKTIGPSAGTSLALPVPVLMETHKALPFVASVVLSVSHRPLPLPLPLPLPQPLPLFSLRKRVITSRGTLE